MIIAGIDEAGYGPLLGPLVVSATAFETGASAPGAGVVGEGAPIQAPSQNDAQELPLDPEDVPCLWRLLKGVVSKKSSARKGRLLIADSKVVHNLAEGNKQLERGVLAFLRSMAPCAANGDRDEPAAAEARSRTPLTVGRLLEALGCTNHELPSHPWYSQQDLPLPWLAESGDLAIVSNMLAAAMDRAKLRTVCMRTAVVSERAFNRMIDGTHNKASALVSVTMSHLHYLHTHFGHKGLIVGIDKQGARDNYTALLLRCFPDAQLKVLLESEHASSYLLQENAGIRDATSQTPAQKRTLIHFREKCENAFLPTALASMICKYLRELCMRSFNDWWCARISGLRPTAGYYQDGSRWLIDVEPHLERLGVRRDMLVRIR